MVQIRGSIRDGVSGERVAAKVHILGSGGQFLHPGNSLLKVGPGAPFFYADGSFEVQTPRGAVDIVVERGTEYVPLRRTLYAPPGGAVEIDLMLERWVDLPEERWYPGNTHIHYNELESRPEERLRLDTEVNDLSVTAVSILQREQIPYASNAFPVGFMTDFSTDHRQVDCGEETRHNAHHGGYGHVMLLNLRNLVEPVSRGDLVSAFDPDYPPLCHACDDAWTQGGIVIWCHNGNGLEAPVAAGLGKLHAFNLFDPCWKDLEYDLWYKLLNCGIRLPASTGSDWYVCSNNRVYVQTEERFTYKSWLEGLKAGRTFITNGPALWLEVEGEGPGAQIEGREKVVVEVRWRSHYALDRVEIVRDGMVVEERVLVGEDQREGEWAVDVNMASDGWVAARVFGMARDSFGQAVYAHASPVYLGEGIPIGQAGDAAAFFASKIAAASETIARYGRFTTDAQREEVLHLFEAGRKIYAKLEENYG